MSYFINRTFYKQILKNFSQENTKLKKKFYKEVSIAEIVNTEFKNENRKETNFKFLQNLSDFGQNYYHVLLDNRKCKTLYLDELKLPTKKLALGIAEEFERQKEDINFYSMHFVN
jgi:chaperone required for assembly of F1-ATPase